VGFVTLCHLPVVVCGLFSIKGEKRKAYTFPWSWRPALAKSHSTGCVEGVEETLSEFGEGRGQRCLALLPAQPPPSTAWKLCCAAVAGSRGRESWLGPRTAPSKQLVARRWDLSAVGIVFTQRRAACLEPSRHPDFFTLWGCGPYRVPPTRCQLAFGAHAGSCSGTSPTMGGEKFLPLLRYSRTWGPSCHAGGQS